MEQYLRKLGNGSEISIVGGGPAGNFFALYLLKYAGEMGIRPDITIYEPRDFAEPGPKGCKGCAGLLSASLLHNLGELNLSLPGEIIQKSIEEYTVHSLYASITMSKLEKNLQIMAVYRGSGPRLSHNIDVRGFDPWLLQQAENRGVKIERKRVTSIFTGQEPGIEVAGERLHSDLVVLASGINAPPINVVGIQYIPPKTQIMAQGELYADPDEIKARLGSAAHAFIVPRSGLIFGSLVPKGSFITVSVISQTGYRVAVKDFLRFELVQQMLPKQYEHACECATKAAISSAQHYCADGFIAIGDAAISRLYKDGIGSALFTAREAARTVVGHGLNETDFKRYYQAFCRDINRDNWWGQKLFHLNNMTQDSRFFFIAQQKLIGNEQNNTLSTRPFTKATWGMFTGIYSYRRIIRMLINPVSLIKLCIALFQGGIKTIFRGRDLPPRGLHVGGKKVLILGSGFGGTYVLRRLVPALNRNENVETTMVSDENFFLFSPLLHEVAMGRIETRHIAYPIRRLHWRDRFNFVQAAVQKIDLNQRCVTTPRGTFDFDYLVLALGSVSNTSELSQVSEGKNVFTLKSLQDSRLIRNHIIERFEYASMEKDAAQQKQLLTFVICGGGYVGVQIATELRDFLYRSLARFYPEVDANNIRIILVEQGANVTAQLHPKLASHVMKRLERSEIQVRLRSRLTRITADHVEINGTDVLPATTVIWVPGLQANPLIAELPVERDNIGRVLVNNFMEIPQMPGLYAVGDCAHFTDPRSGQPIPPRAHIAVRQAKVVARNILADLRGEDRSEYRYSNSAEALSLGSSDAVVRFHGLRLYGFPARLFWLFGYSFLVTGTTNRVRIIMDWLLSLVFGRDVTFIKPN